MFYQSVCIRHSCSFTQSRGSILPSIVETRDQNSWGLPPSLEIGIWNLFAHRGQKSYTPTATTCWYPQCEIVALGSKPTPGPNANGFASQWNIGVRFSLYFMIGSSPAKLGHIHVLFDGLRAIIHLEMTEKHNN